LAFLNVLDIWIQILIVIKVYNWKALTLRNKVQIDSGRKHSIPGIKDDRKGFRVNMSTICYYDSELSRKYV
jgi:hypothetical protein